MKKQIYILFSILISLVVMAGCGSSSDDPTPTPPTSTETTTVSGTVLAANGLPINEANVTISSTPITETTDANGNFSAEVEAGTHSIVIKKDTATIYTGTFTCSKDKPLDMGSMSTIYRPLSDTGQTHSYTDTFGEDHNYIINWPSFTNNGDGTVTDNASGIMWMEDSLNESYNWWRASGTYDATYNPDTQDACGSLTTGGYDDWRLPKVDELMGVVNYGKAQPAINSTVFKGLGTGLEWYWSSSESKKIGSGGQETAFPVDFKWGQVIYKYNTDKYYVRCVRGGESAMSFNDNGDGTVTDNVTGLMWQKEDDNTVRKWDPAISYCEDLSLSTYTDWRLPNIKELGSILDNSQDDPAIDSTAFPNTNSYGYWSSTGNAGSSNTAWHLNFTYGRVLADSHNKNYNFRCVRGGEIFDFSDGPRPLCGSTPYDPLTECCNRGTGEIMDQYDDSAMSKCEDTRVARPSECYEPETDGCSNPFFGDLKNNPVITPPLCLYISFKAVCDQHDICYATCGRTQKNCDDTFFTNMKDLCSKTENLPCIVPCLAWAGIYYEAVSQHKDGLKAYMNNQNDACQCCTEPLEFIYFEEYGEEDTC